MRNPQICFLFHFRKGLGDIFMTELDQLFQVCAVGTIFRRDARFMLLYTFGEVVTETKKKRMTIYYHFIQMFVSSFILFSFFLWGSMYADQTSTESQFDDWVEGFDITAPMYF